uniref:Uncharacterized protein n=1 Tax=viral metagenome TaxID=1070528 RepID=A0A6C0C6A8_9ZZZZ
MNHQTILCCVVALILGMLLANMLKNVCGCKLVEGQSSWRTNIPDHPYFDECRTDTIIDRDGWCRRVPTSRCCTGSTDRIAAQLIAAAR